MPKADGEAAISNLDVINANLRLLGKPCWKHSMTSASVASLRDVS